MINLFVENIRLELWRLGQFTALSQISCMTYNKLFILTVFYLGDWRLMLPCPMGTFVNFNGNWEKG